ncbi:MAG TPA: ATP-binding cassette domain-containing protein [Candidatus Methanoculleus thermohydrogenotrophicum]|jgi:molybdopterin-binding protein|nr:ATP-binding cassette domain-containing protein [Candidatus Methanoculleus thermohydrogenotrophicum]NLM81097.1 ATP-binding cassette domain-containing protein [Candidatus Methanoculleus thermohydrogenotrophicum]HOB17159.1 ATP-binding cassette domain-containing protein [Candidatus Methanoculleus thermohydrogenotrophicum]HPZ37238.1 ATP-binding cassette domain-containing protein [Candidatus Methanoculleus thermohydrogenotrophicum]HQC90548.1 ATP-binding cassette domain-containing protein [Candidat
MLKIRNLSLSLGEFSLDGVDLTVADGEYFIIIGPTGAGKTILLETIAGIYTPDSGTIILDGRDITHTDPKDRGIGMVYQDYILFPHLTVEENIGFGLLQRKVDPGRIRDLVSEIADLLGIGHLLERTPGTLSGGEQQRAAIARALVLRPRVLLLDEPLSALDAATRDRLRRELKLVHRATGTTVVHITHHFEDIFALADRVAVMQEGRIAQIGTPDDVFRRPATEFVAAFTGMENIFYGVSRVRDGEATIDLGTITLRTVTAVEGDVCVGIRPEEVIVSREAFESSAINVFSGTVTEIRQNGIFSRVVVDTGLPFVAILTPQSVARLGLTEGKPAYVTFKASAVHVFGR